MRSVAWVSLLLLSASVQSTARSERARETPSRERRFTPSRHTPPLDVFFVGNSFTFGGPVPRLVQALAASAGFAEPNVAFRALGGRSLRWHRQDRSAGSAARRLEEGWDVVVLQDFSTRPTDAGDPGGFRDDALWFHERARSARQGAQVVLFETWAREAEHPIYPERFRNPMDMQRQLRFHYEDAASNHIPASSESANVVVAPVGDAWEANLANDAPQRLHDVDDYHAGPAGQYLSALVLYATIYRTSTRGLPPIGVEPSTALALQQSADETTGYTTLPPTLRRIAANP